MSIELHMLPVKAGDATLIVDYTPERPFAVLIDAGLADEEVVAYLQKVGVYHLDLVIISHPDLDHLQGLLAVVKNPLISISTIWCFDLGFLREFVTTGKLPRPQQGTHRVLYERLVYTLVAGSDLLKAAMVRGIECLQVSEGFRLNLGSLHLEVIYPWDGFYNSLRSSSALKKLLTKRWPDDWFRAEGEPTNPNDENVPPLARPVTTSEDQQVVLEELMKTMHPPASDEVLNTSLAGSDLKEEETEQNVDSDDEFPISLLGTLYNNLSIVVRVHVTGGISPPKLLFPGDLTDWTYLVARRTFDLGADVFKYPHHGSSGSGISVRFFKKNGFPPCAGWWKEWISLWDTLIVRGRGQGSALFCELVKPTHTLIYPYPSKNLPKASVMVNCLGTIHANRKSQNLGELTDAKNLPEKRVLLFGRERRDIATT